MLLTQSNQGVPGLTIENAYPLSNTELGVLLCLAAEDLKQERLETYLLETWNPKLRQELSLNPHEFLPLQLPMIAQNVNACFPNSLIVRYLAPYVTYKGTFL